MHNVPVHHLLPVLSVTRYSHQKLARYKNIATLLNDPSITAKIKFQNCFYSRKLKIKILILRSFSFVASFAIESLPEWLRNWVKQKIENSHNS